MSDYDRFSAKLMVESSSELGIALLDLILLLEKYSDNLPDHFKIDLSNFIDEVLSFQDSLLIFHQNIMSAEVSDNVNSDDFVS